MTVFTIAPVTSNDIWIAGRYINTASQAQAFYEHFDGSHWAIVAAPVVGNFSSIYNMTVVSANDIWAVGGYQIGSNPGTLDTALIEHWDGSRWSRVDHDNTSGDLLSTTVLSAANVWAVGVSYYYDKNYSASQPVVATRIEHFDGSRWKVVSSPSPDKHSGLNSISPISATDIWTVGVSASNPIADHYDGSNWVAQSPTASDNNTTFSSVSAVSANDVWAVGNTASGVLLDHWNGTNWTSVTNPSLASSNYSLISVLALQPQNVWALGTYSTDTATNLPRILHLDGSGWNVIALPDALTQMFVWQRLGHSNTLVALGTYNGQMRLITITQN